MFYFSDSSSKKLTWSITLSNIEIEDAQNNLNAEDLFWKYHHWAIEGISNLIPTQFTDEKVWKKLTKPQRMLLCLGLFIPEVNNGGVWQFLFNKSEYYAATSGALEELDVWPLDNDYFECVKEFMDMAGADELTKVFDIWDNPTLSFEERWAAFKSGEKHIPSAKKIESYFYKDDFKEKLYNRINSYIKKNLGSLINVHSEKTTQIINKKDAIPHFTQYLKDCYQTDPLEVSIYYSAKVTIDNIGTNLFLMAFKMPDGFESIGISGHFTHHFNDIHLSEINKMYKKHHKQELINFYHGWYLLENELKINPKAKELDEDLWLKTLNKLHLKSNTQIPVNVKLIDYVKYKGDNIYIYSGDLMYNEKSTIFPEDLSNVNIKSVRDKTHQIGEPYGELNLIFNTFNEGSFGRRSAEEAIFGTHTLISVIGKGNKIIKDNPWGF